MKQRGCSQVRADVTTPSASASMRTATATSCRSASPCTNRSAVVRTLKQTASADSSGGSKPISHASSGGGVREPSAVGAAPCARCHTLSPKPPNRLLTSDAESRAKSPRVVSPSRRSRSASSRPSDSLPSVAGSLHRERLQERRRRPGRHHHAVLDHRLPGGLLGGEQVVGDTEPAVPHPGVDQVLGDERGGVRLPSEVAPGAGTASSPGRIGATPGRSSSTVASTGSK